MFFAKALEIDPEYSPGQNGMGDTYTYEIAVLGNRLSFSLLYNSTQQTLPNIPISNPSLY